MTSDWNGGHVEARQQHKHTAQQTCGTDFVLKMWYDSIDKGLFYEHLVANTTNR